MGSSRLQGIVIEYILWILFSKIDRKKFKALTNEQGQDVDKKNNLSADIAIYETNKFDVKDPNKQLYDCASQSTN